MLRNIKILHINVTLLVMPVVLAPADVISYLEKKGGGKKVGRNDMGPNNILLFANILQEGHFHLVV